MEKNNSAKIKNAAVCFSGLARNLDLCYPYIKKNLLDQIGSHDIFCCIEDDENADKMQLLNPVKSEKINSKDVDKIISNELKSLNRQNYKKFFFPESSRFNLRNVYQQVYKVNRTLELLEEYMKEKNISYRYYIRIRFDLMPIDAINLKNLNIHEKEIVVNKMSKGSDKDQIDDMFCITSNFETFKSYCSVYKKMREIILEKIPFKPSLSQKIYFFFERKYVYGLISLFKIMPSKKFFKNLLGFLLLLPKKFYKNFKARFRSSLERILFYCLEEKKIKIREEKIDFVIVRNLTDGLLSLG